MGAWLGVRGAWLGVRGAWLGVRERWEHGTAGCKRVVQSDGSRAAGLSRSAGALQTFGCGG